MSKALKGVVKTALDYQGSKYEREIKYSGLTSEQEQKVWKKKQAAKLLQGITK